MTSISEQVNNWFIRAKKGNLPEINLWSPALSEYYHKIQIHIPNSPYFTIGSVFLPDSIEEDDMFEYIDNGAVRDCSELLNYVGKRK